MQETDGFNVFEEYKAGQLSKEEYINKMYNRHDHFYSTAEQLSDSENGIAKIEILPSDVIFHLKISSQQFLIRQGRYQLRSAPLEALNFEGYEKDEVQAFCNLVEESGSKFFIDLGANIGFYSMLFCKLAQKKSPKVLAFEPAPQNFKLLCSNIALNKIEGIFPLNFGAAEKNSFMDLHYSERRNTAASLASLYPDETMSKISVPVVRIDDIISCWMETVDFIKCDVEGAEKLVVEGALQSIKQHTPLVMMELLRKWSAKFNYHPQEVLEIFFGCGYRCFTRNNGKWQQCDKIDENTVETNFFFMHSAKHSKLIREFS